MSKMIGAAAVADAIRLEMKRDPKLFLEGIDVRHMGGALTQYQGLYKEFGGDRVYDMPISESSYTGFAVGMAMCGIPTIVEIQFADFITYAFDAISSQAAKLRYMNDGRVNIPLTIIASQGTGFYYGAQHSQIVESWFANQPGLKIVVPSTAADHKGLLASAIRDPDPVLFLPSKACIFDKGEVPEGEYLVPIGKADLVKEGTDVTIIAWQRGLSYVKKALTELEKAGVNAEVIDLRSLIPYDKQMIAESVAKTGRAMIVHEAHVRGGYGGEIAAFIASECFDKLKAPVKRIGSANIPIPFGGSEDFIVPQINDIVNTAVELVKA